nr:MAG TPA: hypothetical protein [Inoviridae sp.]
MRWIGFCYSKISKNLSEFCGIFLKFHGLARF